MLEKLKMMENIPSISDLRTKISDVKVGNDYCIEAIILKIPGRREVQTKTGELISLSEMFVEDDTGQIWLKGWRNQARLLDNFSIGEIISVTGVTARSGLEDRVELFLTAIFNNQQEKLRIPKSSSHHILSFCFVNLLIEKISSSTIFLSNSCSSICTNTIS